MPHSTSVHPTPVAAQHPYVLERAFNTIAGTATDVARRGPDGLWRYVVDNPFGTTEDPEQTGRPTEVGPAAAAAGPTSRDGTGQSAIGR
ncbi:hypothetical protein ACIPYR_16745 [Streptomyces parvus]|uniref:hypothetical protein n=1 Tax=Streptomyces parvus TaxID=66428 RepID=UPI0038276683